MKATEIKQRQWFSALIGESAVIGKVYVDGKDIYLCQDMNDGGDSPDKLGFRFSWVIKGKSRGELDFLNESVTEFKLYTRKPKLDITKVNRVCEYEVRRHFDKLKFGCGEVIIPVSKIKAFVAITKILKEREITLSEIDWEVLKAHF